MALKLGVTPVPVSGIVCGLLTALLVIVSVCEDSPVAVGLKEIVAWQFPPTGIAVQGVVTEKGAAVVMDWIVRG